MSIRDVRSTSTCRRDERERKRPRATQQGWRRLKQVLQYQTEPWREPKPCHPVKWDVVKGKAARLLLSSYTSPTLRWMWIPRPRRDLLRWSRPRTGCQRTTRSIWTRSRRSTKASHLHPLPTDRVTLTLARSSRPEQAHSAVLYRQHVSLPLRPSLHPRPRHPPRVDPRLRHVRDDLHPLPPNRQPPPVGGQQGPRRAGLVQLNQGKGGPHRPCLDGQGKEGGPQRPG